MAGFRGRTCAPNSQLRTRSGSAICGPCCVLVRRAFYLIPFPVIPPVPFDSLSTFPPLFPTLFVPTFSFALRQSIGIPNNISTWWPLAFFNSFIALNDVLFTASLDRPPFLHSWYHARRPEFARFPLLAFLKNLGFMTMEL